MEEPGAVNLSAAEAKGLREDLLASVCSQATMQLGIIQRAQRLKSAVFDPKCLPAIATMGTMTTTQGVGKRRASSTANKLPQVANGRRRAVANMPNERVLNEVKFEKDLDMLKDVFEQARQLLAEDQNPEQEGAVEQPRSSATNGEVYTAEIVANEQTPTARLVAFIEAQGMGKNRQEEVTQELRHSQAALQALKTQLDAERQEAERRMAAQDDRLATLRHNLRNVQRVNDLELDLVERWEQNRCVQAEIACGNEERALQTQVDELQRRLQGEQLAIACVQKCHERQYAELRERIATWQCRYATQMAAVQAQIAEQQRHIADVTKLHERHRQICAERKEFVRVYAEQKADQRRLEEQQQRRIDSAVRIQAWWRGVMVRRSLGPYRKKPKKARKPKDK